MDVGRSISVTVRRSCRKMTGAQRNEREKHRQEEEAARVSASQPDTDWQRGFLHRHDRFHAIH